MPLALLALLWACGAKEPLPIGAAIRFSKSAPCGPSEHALEELRQAARRGEREFYSALDRLQAVELKPGDSATVISATPDTVRVRLPDGSVNRLRDNTCWTSREAVTEVR